MGKVLYGSAMMTEAIRHGRLGCEGLLLGSVRRRTTHIGTLQLLF